jgi:PIN domain nuclease of toxin-antitoxin system
LGSIAMIVIDTHIWVWWVHGDGRLTQTQIDAIPAFAFSH